MSGLLLSVYNSCTKIKMLTYKGTHTFYTDYVSLLLVLCKLGLHDGHYSIKSGI